MKTINKIYSMFIICLLLTFTASCELFDAFTPNEGDVYLKATGKFVDYTGLDGCGFVFETNDGNKLEVSQVLVKDFTPASGLHATISYLNLDVASICMVGQPVAIYKVETLESCKPIVRVDRNSGADSLKRDPLRIETVKIVDDCLFIKVQYGGGCEDHTVDLLWFPNWCGTPPVPPESLVIAHNAHNDACKALITKDLSFDLTPLRKTGQSEVKLTVSDNNESFELTYKY